MASRSRTETSRPRAVRRPSPPPASNGSHASALSISTDPSLTPPRVRRKPGPSPAHHRAGDSVVMNRTFQKLLCLLFVIVAFDIVYVWDYFEKVDEQEGPEAGMHHLHQNKRLGNLYQEILSGLQIARAGAELLPGHPENYAGMTSEEKVEELEREVHLLRKKYEDAMGRLGENPYPDLQKHPGVPYTARPPNKMVDDAVFKPKKTKAELQGMDTHGVDAHIVKILHSARVEIDEELAEQLPTWDDVVSMFGDKPIVSGLEMCEPYREQVKAADRMIGPAGMFNTGTNLLFELLKKNCAIPEARYSTTHHEPRKNGMRWQVPWGKHNPPTTHRNKNIAKAWGRNPTDGKKIIQENFFPVVLIKDPYSWMGSQCRHKYTTFWGHDDKHCPNLIRWRIPDKDVPSEVRVKFALNMKLYESLLDMWNKWYEEWEDQTFPHLTTRFEDLLFHGEEVTRTACECVGGVFTDDFEYVEDSAKPASFGIHKGANGLVKAMLQYGDPSKRLNGFTERDRIYASKTVDTELMNKFGYSAPPLPT
ncbi:hypothetical protein ACHAXT_002188 [Thalassiosira profunda]